MNACTYSRTVRRVVTLVRLHHQLAARPGFAASPIWTARDYRLCTEAAHLRGLLMNAANEISDQKERAACPVVASSTPAPLANNSPANNGSAARSASRPMTESKPATNERPSSQSSNGCSKSTARVAPAPTATEAVNASADVLRSQLRKSKRSELLGWTVATSVSIAFEIASNNCWQSIVTFLACTISWACAWHDIFNVSEGE